jgi:hypothetical protein
MPAIERTACSIWPGKHLDAAQVDQVVGASGKGTDGADVRPAAATARAVERRVVADQKTKLRRGFRVEIGADREPALGVSQRLARLRIDGFPNLHVLEQVR